MFEIEKGVPLLGKGSGTPYAKWPFREMEVGDSFLCPIPATDKAACGRLSSAVSWWGTRHKQKFATRKVEGGVRVWRIA